MKRIAITGMSVNTPLGDSLEVFPDNLLQGRSAITRWKALDTSGIYPKVGGDPSEYDVEAKMPSLRSRIPEEVLRRARRLMRFSPRSTNLSILLAVDAFLDAGLSTSPAEPGRVSAIVTGQNINGMHSYKNWRQSLEAPSHIDAPYALNSLDSDHAECMADVLGIQGPRQSIPGPATAAEHLEATLGPGALIGELRLFTKLPSETTCVAAAPTEVLNIHKGHFHEIMKIYPTIGINLCLFFALKLAVQGMDPCKE